MTTFDLTTMPLLQLAELLRAQLSLSKRQELAELLVQKPAETLDSEEFPLADDLRAAVAEVKHYKRGEIKLKSLDEILHELRNSSNA